MLREGRAGHPRQVALEKNGKISDNKVTVFDDFSWDTWARKNGSGKNGF